MRWPCGASLNIGHAHLVTLAWLFCRDDSQRYSVGANKLTSEEARRIGKAISRIPEFMRLPDGTLPDSWKLFQVKYTTSGGRKRSKISLLSCCAFRHVDPLAPFRQSESLLWLQSRLDGTFVGMRIDFLTK